MISLYEFSSLEATYAAKAISETDGHQISW